MILDNSGFDLGLIFYGSAMKMLILLSLITAIIIPQQIRLIYSIIFYLVLMCVLGVTIGTIESSIARMRMSRVFEFIFSATSLSLIVLSLIAINLYSH
jgi:formate hydrogenlyase subunit 4